MPATLPHGHSKLAVCDRSPSKVQLREFAKAAYVLWSVWQSQSGGHQLIHQRLLRAARSVRCLHLVRISGVGGVGNLVLEWPAPSNQQVP